MVVILLMFQGFCAVMSMVLEFHIISFYFLLLSWDVNVIWVLFYDMFVLLFVCYFRDFMSFYVFFVLFYVIVCYVLVMLLCYVPAI